MGKALLPGMLLALGLWAAPVQADAVQTLGGRLEGKVHLRAGSCEIGGKTAAWNDLLYVIMDHSTRSIRPPQAVRLASGEVWLADVVALSARKLKARSVLFGEREIDAGTVRSLDFLSDLAAPAPGDKPGTLYREKGEPIPGALLWIDDQRLAIDSPLGVLTLPREGTARYLFQTGPAVAPPAKDEEIGLVDGTVLRGKAAPVQDALEVEHAVLGKLTIPAAAVRSVLRHVPAAAYLAELPMQSVDAVPLVASPALPETLEYPTRGDSRAWPGPLACLRGICIQPKTVVKYRLPKAAGPTATLFATLGPVDEARGDVKVRIASGDKALVERDLSPAAKPEALSLPVPSGGELTIEVDFGPRIAFPCGVVLGDPLVVLR